MRATVRACVRATVRACDRAIGARERGVECGARDEDTKRSVAPHHDDAGVTPVFRGTCKNKVADLVALGAGARDGVVYRYRYV